MKKLLFAALFLSLTSLMFGQTEKGNFLTKMEVEWMNTEIQELEKYYNIIAKALEEKDGIEVSRNKTEIIKSVTTLASNSQHFYNKLMLDGERADSRRQAVSDNPPNYYYNKRKNNPKNQELLLSAEDMQTFEANFKEMQRIKDYLKSSSFALHPQQAEAQDNLYKVSDFLEIARKNNQIIQNAKK